MNGTQIGVSVLVFLSLLSASSPMSFSPNPNQLTTVTYFNTFTTTYTNTSYSTNILQIGGTMYSGSIQIPASYAGCSIYSLGPFVALAGYVVSAAGKTDDNLTLSLWPSEAFAPIAQIMNKSESAPNAEAEDEAEAACATFNIVGDMYRSVLQPQSSTGGGSPFNFTWKLEEPGAYYFVLSTDGLNNANVNLQLTRSEYAFQTYTMLYTPSTTVTSIQGYWVGQGMIYPIVKNAFLIAGLSALIVLCVVAVVLGRRRTGKH